MNLTKIGALTEEQARGYLENIRWPNGPICPHCGSKESVRLQGESTRPGLLKCKAKECRKQFTVTIGSIFEDSHISCRQWIMAFHLMVSSKKGISALQLQRNLGLGSYRTAWHLAHRIREAMKKEPLASMLQGIVEADETYVGGKPRPGTGPHKTGFGTKKKPVMVLVERDGKSVVKHLERVDSKSLKGTIEANVAKSAIIMTDELGLYRGLNKTFAGHEKVRHGIRQYAKRLKDGLVVHTNTAESFFALLKRGHMGAFHQMSKKHLHRYCNEFGFRWDHRHVTDGERMAAAIRGAEGRRLTYRPLKGSRAG
jgi:transposase-like protein